MNNYFAQKCVISGELINIHIIFEFCAAEDCVSFLKLGKFFGFLLFIKKTPNLLIFSARWSWVR